MDRLEKMEGFLKKIADEIKEDYSFHDVYDNLCTYGLSDEDIAWQDGDEQLLSDMDKDYYSISKLKNIKFRMEAFNLEDNWISAICFPRLKNFSITRNSHFMYFRDGEVNDNFEEFISKSSIKMYIPLGKKGALKIPQMLLELLGEIRHDTKIASEIRTDDLVVRINSVEDAERISEFINAESEFDEPKYSEFLIEPNPFVIQNNNIGYASDRNLSYNANIANLIFEYINDLQQKKALEQVSVSGLESFVKEKYNSLFIEGENLQEYRDTEFDAHREGSFEKWLMNKMEVMDMFLIALNPENGIEKFYQHYADINDIEYNNELESYFTALINGEKQPMPQKPSSKSDKPKEIQSNLEQKEEEQQELESEEELITETEKLINMQKGREEKDKNTLDIGG